MLILLSLFEILLTNYRPYRVVALVVIPRFEVGQKSSFLEYGYD